MYRLRGATVARLTPDQKVACSNHVGVKGYFEIIQNFVHDDIYVIVKFGITACFVNPSMLHRIRCFYSHASLLLKSSGSAEI